MAVAGPAGDAVARPTRRWIEVGGRQSIGCYASDLDLDVDDAVPIRVQLEDRTARAIRCADQVAGGIEAVIGVELEVLIIRHAGVGVDVFQDNEVATGLASALEIANHVPNAGANPRRAVVEDELVGAAATSEVVRPGSA